MNSSRIIVSEEVKEMQTESSAASQTSSYRSIFKATSLFGGVQVYQIIIQIIKSKFVAILLGPAGVGILGLFQSALDLVKNFTSFGLSGSAVRDVSVANSSNDIGRISRIVSVLRRLVVCTGLLGMLTTVIFSPLLSKGSFGSFDYTIPFIFLSVTLLFDQMSAGQKVKLQGLRKLKDLAMCSLIGVTFSLFITVPIYYWLGVKGIVPTLILNSIIVWLVSSIYSNRVNISAVKVSLKESFRQGREMIVLGLSMSISPILVTMVAYILRSYIQNVAGLETVGLFQAGFVIMNTYVGLIFNAIATDYFPRLAAVNKDNEKCSLEVSQQGEISAMILSPLLSICIIFMPFVLQLLYSDRFLAANDYIIWACVGMMFRLSSWVIGFLFAAKADSKLFVINEVSGNVYYLLFSVIGFHFWGLKGLGIAFALDYVCYFIQVLLIARSKYNFHFHKGFYRAFIPQLLLVCSCLLIVLLTQGWLKYLLGVIVIFISIYLSLSGLNKKLDIIGLIRKGNK